MRHLPPARRDSERGYTLAALLVILTVMSVIIAFSVPKMWSDIMQRERDHQTLFAMKQYARAIQEFQKARGALPVSLDQLEEQKEPRVLRQLYPNPLSGELDWILVPFGTPSGGAQAPVPGVTPGTAPPGSQPPAQPQPGVPSTSPGGGQNAVPFIGVRPPQTGESFLSLNGSDRYEQWLYTIEDLAKEQTPTPPGTGPVSGSGPPGTTPPGGQQPRRP
jgi:type II secretory pathway pseudopilin PulG